MVAVCATDPPLRMVSTMTCSLVGRSESKLFVLPFSHPQTCFLFRVTDSLYILYYIILYCIVLCSIISYHILLQELVKPLFHSQKDD